MNSEIRKLLESVRSGETSVDDAMLELKKAPFEDIGYAKVDLHRKVRQGAAAVIGAGRASKVSVAWPSPARMTRSASMSRPSTRPRSSTWSPMSLACRRMRSW